MEDRGLSKPALVVAVLAVAAAVVLLLAHGFLSWFACGMDTSYCADSRDKAGLYTGQLILEGEPYERQPFTVRFESRRDLPPVPFETSDDGRYCVVWAREAIVPFPYTPDGRPLENAGDELGGLRSWEQLTGGPPPGCEEGDAGIPWNRAGDIDSSWQFWIGILLPLAAIGFLVAAIARRKNARSWMVWCLGLAGLAANVVALVLLWGTG